MSDNDFNPDDINELEERFGRIVSDSENGYVMELLVSRDSAKGLLKCWIAACLGDQSAMKESMAEYGRIMQELKEALKEDER